ncbi:hypothetical protein GQ55_6G071300 [Panicum hallii var. hallii]|uniref:Uncharacterized protein n=1 Tax=Panicum hallii var. hallii TaxID=1504633 RepID=A0A2T7D503_9POAL|nr:hypothetical protein GQ55_6G071300 [Panicum hallii var. hallii]
MQPRMTCRQPPGVDKHLSRQVCPWLHLTLCLSCVALTWLECSCVWVSDG